MNKREIKAIEKLTEVLKDRGMMLSPGSIANVIQYIYEPTVREVEERNQYLEKSIKKLEEDLFKALECVVVAERALWNEILYDSDLGTEEEKRKDFKRCLKEAAAEIEKEKLEEQE